MLMLRQVPPFLFFTGKAVWVKHRWPALPRFI